LYGTASRYRSLPNGLEFFLSNPAQTLLAAMIVQMTVLGVVSYPAWSVTDVGRETRRLTSRGAIAVIVGLALMSARGVVHGAASIVVANALLLSGYRNIFTGVYVAFGLPPPPAWERWLTRLAIVAVAALWAADPSADATLFAQPRLLVASLPMAAISGYLVVTLMRKRMRPWPLGARYVATAAAFGCVTNAGRPVAFLFVDGHVDPLKTPVAIVAVGSALGSSLLLYIGIAMQVETRAREHLEHKNEQLSQQAFTDGLTGLANRRHLEDTALIELARSRRHGWPLTVLLIDVDHFKRVNDRFGHATGDAVLRETAKSMLIGLRSHDMLARWGGEEFALLLPHCSPADAEQVAQRILTSVRQATLPALEGGHVTVSIGIAAARDDDDDFHAVLRRADRALYRAKDAGRNQFKLSEQPEQAA
jgi:diguanylate cyclase (GGDEF)-like protein